MGTYCSNGLHFIERTKRRTADLGGMLEGRPVLCEVKTINRSMVELVFCPATNYFERNLTMTSAAVFLD